MSNARKPTPPPLPPLKHRSPTSGVPELVIEEPSGVNEEPFAAIQRRTREIRDTTSTTSTEVADLRKEVRDHTQKLEGYVERDLTEHAEIRERFATFDNRLGLVNTQLGAVNAHVGDLRVESAKTSSDVGMLADAHRAKLEEEAEAKGEKKEKRSHARHLLVALITLVAAVIGWLAHAHL